MPTRTSRNAREETTYYCLVVCVGRAYAWWIEKEAFGNILFERDRLPTKECLKVGASGVETVSGCNRLRIKAFGKNHHAEDLRNYCAL